MRLDYQLGPYIDGRREATSLSWPTPTWLSDKRSDPNELVNLAGSCPDKLLEMQQILKQTLQELNAPPEQYQRLGLDELSVR